jgi:hypothetical protein
VDYSRYYPDICLEGRRALSSPKRSVPRTCWIRTEYTSDVRSTVLFHDMACFGRPELTAGDLRSAWDEATTRWSARQTPRKRMFFRVGSQVRQPEWLSPSLDHVLQNYTSRWLLRIGWSLMMEVACSSERSMNCCSTTWYNSEDSRCCRDLKSWDLSNRWR